MKTLKDIMGVFNKVPDVLKWKVQSFTKKRDKALCVPYIDVRTVANILDSVEVLWKDECILIDHEKIKIKKNNIQVEVDKYVVQCIISIKIGDDWIHKSDVGVGLDVEAEKSAYSDAFKRSAVKWGIGRGLRDKRTVYVKLRNGDTVTDDGERIWDLTEHINKLQNGGNYNRPSNNSYHQQRPQQKPQQKFDVDLEKVYEEELKNSIALLKNAPTRDEAQAVVKENKHLQKDSRFVEAIHSLTGKF